MIKYFHELTAKEFSDIVKTKIKWDKCAELYPQPEWCNYPDATRGLMGCWSLTGHLIHSRKDCRKCDLYMPKKRNERDA